MVYMDDIIVIGNNKDTIDNIICQLRLAFSLKDLESLNYFLGIEIVPHVSSILVSQKKYILELLQRDGLSNCNPVSSPMVTSSTLSLDDNTTFSNSVKYRQVVGALQYVTLSRPAIAFAVNKHGMLIRRSSGSIVQAFTDVLWKCSPDTSLEAFLDADWAGDSDDRPSTGGFAIYLGSNLISWTSYKQRTVLRSSTKAEYKALDDLVAELTWLQALLHELGIRSSSPPILWCDNLSATYLSANLIFHACTKHVEIDFHFVREKVAQGDLQIQARGCCMSLACGGVLEQTRLDGPVQLYRWVVPIRSFSDLGGLGLGSFRAKNLGLLAKWQWRFLNEKDAVWNKLISSLYGPHGGFNLVGSRLQKGVWQNILNVGGAIDALGISFRHSFKRKVGSGSQIRFWTKNWSDDGPCFKEKFPRLYALESNKNCFLQDRWVFLNGEWRSNWEWRIQPRGRAEGDMINLENLLNGLALESDVSDGWRWSLNHNKGFSMNHLSKMIDSSILSLGCLGRVFKWNNWVPRKVNIFNWRAINDRIPHLSNLDKWGIDVHSLLCPLCDSAIKDSDHILYNCQKVKSIWFKCFDWWNF
ncbi:putative RNA-directed DNA polymerase [Tanacetum coccineum]